MRSGSSEKLISGVDGVRSMPSARSASPPYGSTKARVDTSTAMALTVKSRRWRSPSMVSPKVTSGLRDSLR